MRKRDVHFIGNVFMAIFVVSMSFIWVTLFIPGYSEYTFHFVVIAVFSAVIALVLALYREPGEKYWP